MGQGKVDEARPLIEALEENDFPTDARLTYQLLQSQLLITTGDDEASWQLADQVWQASQERGNLLQAVDAAIVLADVLERLGKNDESLAVITQGEQLLAALPREPSAALALRQAALIHQRGRISFRKGAYDQALSYFQQSLAQHQELNNNPGIAAALQGIGLIHYYKFDFNQALKHYSQALQLFQEVGNKHRIVWCLTNIGWCYNQNGNWDRALEHAEQGLALSQESGNKRMRAYSLQLLSDIYQGTGDLDLAMEYGKQSLALTQELSDKYQIAWSFGMIGSIHARKSNQNKALECYQQALALFEELDHKPHIAAFLGGIGYVYSNKGDLDRAMEYQQQALALRQELGLKEEAVLSLRAIGRIHWQQGALDQALAQLKQSLTVWEELGIGLRISYTLFDLVSVALDQGTIDQAQHYLQRLQKLNEQEGNKAIDQQYRLAKALMLKASSRIRDKGQAQTLLQEVIEEGPLRHLVAELAMFHLCELLLEELKAYGNSDVFQEAKSLVHRLAEMAQDQQVYSLVVQVLLLQAKFALIEGDLIVAGEFLEQAKVTAAEKSLGLLAERVTAEQRLLEAQLDTWRQLIQRNAPLEERLQQARLTDYLQKAIRLVSTQTREVSP
jgi:tetratricopeptide (TPR) repeat protein